MDERLDDLIAVLRKNKLSTEHLRQWGSIDVDHSKQKGNLNENKKYFKTNLFKQKIIMEIGGGKIPGLYAYYANDTCLYIGKSKDLISRLSSHFYESQMDEEKGDWDRFFRELRRPLKIYFKSITSEDENIGEALRIVFERLLITIINPKFEEFHKIKNKEKKMEMLRNIKVVLSDYSN